MNDIIPFHFENTEVRLVQENGEVFFCLKDVCEILTIINHRRVLADILDEKGVRKTYTPTAGGRQELVFINEPNLYRVIFRSNKSEAKKFQDWVFNEVLPSIRKSGSYNLAQFQIPQSYSEALRLAADQAEEIKVLKPQAEALQRISLSDGSMCITDAAKDLQIQPKKLFDWLSHNKWIYRRAGNKNWIAYQNRIQSGHLEHKVQEVSSSEGESKIREQVLVTPKGLTQLSQLLSYVAA